MVDSISMVEAESLKILESLFPLHAQRLKVLVCTDLPRRINELERLVRWL